MLFLRLLESIFEKLADHRADLLFFVETNFFYFKVFSFSQFLLQCECQKKSFLIKENYCFKNFISRRGFFEFISISSVYLSVIAHIVFWTFFATSRLRKLLLYDVCFWIVCIWLNAAVRLFAQRSLVSLNSFPKYFFDCCSFVEELYRKCQITNEEMHNRELNVHLSHR